jgi:hypothetical protein
VISLLREAGGRPRRAPSPPQSPPPEHHPKSASLPLLQTLGLSPLLLSNTRKGRAADASLACPAQRQPPLLARRPRHSDTLTH